ncbi:MAG TPA: chemotaxis-specific protein-glutamate methyltransferase CheB [Polyangia bacterium]|jgi:two-component system chemotaxis response regulator CheB
MDDKKPIRILVVDDSAFNRQTITAMLEGVAGFQVVGRAGDGEEGLKMAFQLQPDVITLDLEMPKMDGFSFLRLLMARQPTPVLVISGYATRENVFKALELGALDFVAKPSRTITPELRNIEEELIQKVRMVTQLRMVNLVDRAARTRQAGTMSGAFSPPPSPVVPPPSRKEGIAPPRLIAIGASTGGPPAINRILVNLEPTLPLGIVITQHMPAKFTKAFAERLDRTTPWHVREAEEGDAISTGCVLVAPGGGSLVVKREGAALKVAIVEQRPEDRYVPSVDRMLSSCAEAMHGDLCAIVLTGMGGDGGRGIKAVKAAGGRTVAEAPETAVIFGMPQEAIATGAVDDVIALGNIPELIARFALKR